MLILPHSCQRRLYADSAYSLARWAAKNGEDICVLHSSSMPFNTSNPHLHSSDTSMIFWKPTDGITYKDCHPKSKNDCAHADDFQCIKSNPTEEINLEIIGLRRFLLMFVPYGQQHPYYVNTCVCPTSTFAHSYSILLLPYAIHCH